MDPFELALLIGACVTALICIRSPRALLWIAVGAANFAISTTYARHNDAFPPALFTGLCDGATVALILTFAKHKWEMGLAAIFQVMIFTSMLFLTPAFNDRFIYVVALELLNWAALFMVGGTRLLEFVDVRMEKHSWRGFAGRYVHRINLVAGAERKSPRGPFSFVKARR